MALEVAWEAVRPPDGVPAATETPPGRLARELLLYCHGFCAALAGHHKGEDRSLFPAIEAAHPELASTLRLLERDHSMLNQLIGDVLGPF